MAISNIRLKVGKRCANRLNSGHLWVYDNEIKGIHGNHANGDIVSVLDSKGKFIGKGFINDHSKITVRVLTFQDIPLEIDFFKRRIQEALNHRLSLGWTLNDSFRVVSSEGDFLPGLIIDKYNDIMSVQFTTLGMDRRKKQIIEVLKDIFSPSAIIERSDVGVREKEGLKQVKGVLFGNPENHTIIEQDGLSFKVDFFEGHKTGFYFDQRENRLAIKKIVEDKRVLDCFSYTGAFAIYAVKYGASEVIAIEDSGKVMETLNDNIALNGFQDRIKAQKGNAFQWMREAFKSGERFDCVILDPPSFVRAKEAKGGAIRGYKDINLSALKLLNNGGYIVTASCSQNILPATFMNILNESAKDADCAIQIIEIRSQSRDHPVLVSMPETHYLKLIIGRKSAGI